MGMVLFCVMVLFGVKVVTRNFILVDGVGHLFSRSFEGGTDIEAIRVHLVHPCYKCSSSFLVYSKYLSYEMNCTT